MRVLEIGSGRRSSRQDSPPRLFSASEGPKLLTRGLGITNIVPRASASADELSAAELIAGARRLQRKVLRLRPRFLAIVGFGAYRIAFGRPGARGGVQPERIGSTRIWVLPNPSRLNAHHQPGALKVLFEQLRVAAGVPRATAH